MTRANGRASSGSRKNRQAISKSSPPASRATETTCSVPDSGRKLLNTPSATSPASRSIFSRSAPRRRPPLFGPRRGEEFANPPAAPLPRQPQHLLAQRREHDRHGLLQGRLEPQPAEALLARDREDGTQPLDRLAHLAQRLLE